MSDERTRNLDDLPESSPEGLRQAYALVQCRHCNADISRTCLGTVVHTPAGDAVTILYPLRCPECNHPLVATSTDPGIIPVHGHLTS